MWYGMENGMERKFRNGVERCHYGIEWKISRMDWKTIFHTSIPIPSQTSLMAFPEKHIRIVITKDMYKRLAANNLSTN